MVAEAFPVSQLSPAFASGSPYLLFPVQNIVVPPASELPIEVILWGKCIPGWEVVQPLLVQIVHDADGYFNAGDDVFGVYGDGLTREAALRDYKVALAEFYELVEKGACDNSGDLVLLGRLQQFLRRIP